MPQSLQRLIDLLSELPGIGPRQARRMVQFLLRADTSFTKNLTAAILSAREHVAQCNTCFRFDEISDDGMCSLCADHKRDAALLMVVEKDVDIDGVEASSAYHGHYFVLGSLFSLGRGRKQAVEPRTEALKKRIKGVDEVILAFSTTPEGDYTAQELKKTLREVFPQLRVTLLARGLSLGAEIEYADHETLRSALRGRSEEL